MITKQLQQKLTPYYFLAPALAVLTLIILFPIVSNLLMSVHKVQLLKGGEDEFVGLGNYTRLLGSSTFRGSVSASLRFTFLSLPLALVLGMGMALVFNEIRRARPVFTAFLLVPWAIAPVVTGYMWRWLFHDSFGLINHFLMTVGIIDTNVPWLAQPDTAMAATVVANVWRFMPYITIMLLAGLQGIPGDLYEAAHVDGANIVERFVHVTLPQLRHVMAVVFLFATIWMVNDFALIFIMTEGGPAKATLVVPITVYRFAFEHLRLGRGAAAAMILLVFLLSVSAIFIRVIFADRRRQASE
ncbi:MAG TPA: sugar ABC transporter permease [Candidatus Latescibacteria bacterium]|nr:sugar ABC transporter permease [Gemmatimonadaceae bacterium]MDP6018835.1 sugar ABC transporter permease [Candidatus Latescibacterota bacterium]HJP28923.1 sugar ABC transporter permease [Candidatus Latescibacterota bacterium]